MKKKRDSYIALLLAFILGIAVGYLIPKNQADVTELSSQTDDSSTILKSDELSCEGDALLDSDVSEKVNELLPLQENLEAKLATFEGDWAVYVEDLSSGDFIEINNQKMVSASLIKLFIMGAVYSRVEDGTIPEEDVSRQLEQMITVSDNEASNELVAILGGGKYTDMNAEPFQAGLQQVNSYAQGLQCSNTEQQRDMKNSRPNPIPEQNYTSVTDCGRFLSSLYHKQLVSETADTKMLELLKQQTRTGKIPAGLPDGTACANKTGELSDTENDVAIVFTDKGDYVICVMSNNVPDTAEARSNVAVVSQMVYEYIYALPE